MTVNTLITALTRLVKQSPRFAGAQVIYDAGAPVEGGIALNRDAAPLLNLAPIKLDEVGGF